MTFPKKLFRKLFLIACAFLIIIYFGLFTYCYFGWRNNDSPQQVQALITNINNAPVLTDSFYLTYDQLHANRHLHITTQYFSNFWKEILGLPIQKNWQKRVANDQYDLLSTSSGKLWIGLRANSLAFRLDRKATPEKCFDFVMTDLYSQYCRIFRIQDTITNLYSQEKIIRFIIAKEQLQYYKTHPSAFEHEVDSVKKIIHP